MSNQRDPNTPAVLLVGVVGTIVIFALVVALIAVYQNVEQQQLQDKVYSVAPQEISQLEAKHRAQLNGYRHLPGDEGKVALPIERAMELSITELNALEEPADELPNALMSNVLVEMGFYIPAFPASASAEPFPVELDLFPDDVRAEILEALAAPGGME